MGEGFDLTPLPVEAIPPRHPVADAGLVEDVGRVVPIFAQLAPQILHDRLGAAGVHRTQYSLKELSVSQHPTSVDRKLEEHTVLDVRHLHGANREIDAVFDLVDRQGSRH